MIFRRQHPNPDNSLLLVSPSLQQYGLRQLPHSRKCPRHNQRPSNRRRYNLYNLYNHCRPSR